MERLLDRSVAAEAYVIRAVEDEKERYVDLSQIDFDEVAKRFAKQRKRIEAERLRQAVERAVEQLLRMNRTRMDFKEKFQRLIDEYNAGSINVEIFFKQLLVFAKELSEEEKRAISESLTEEELAIFDLLTKPEMDLIKKEREQVKKVAKDLLDTLKTEKLVLDWRKRQQARADGLVTIEEILDQGLPDNFTRKIFEEKCELVYQHVYDSYMGEGRGIYATVGTAFAAREK